MTTIRSIPRPDADTAALSGARVPDFDFDAVGAHDFTQMMGGFAAAAPAAQGPSAISQWVRVPAQAFTEGMADIQEEPPEGMTVTDSVTFYAKKSKRFYEMKTLYNVAGIVLRTVRKDIETVLNNK